jgi:phosphatidate cytidylyltransferase
VLRTRVATALVLAAVLLVVLFLLPTPAGSAFFALALLVGAWEWAPLAGCHSVMARLAYVLATAGLGALTYTATRDVANLHWLLTIACVWWGVAVAWLALRPGTVSTLSALLAGQLVLVPTGIAIDHLLVSQPLASGNALLLCMMLIVWAADIGAYFAGRRFGRLKLAPAVSPNKTWEGVIGGAIFAVLVGVLEARWLGVPAAPYMGLVLVVVFASIVGDLTESMFKRVAGLKDSGTLLPGHGGVLDRIDSITAAAPFYVLGLSWFGGGV